MKNIYFIVPFFLMCSCGTVNKQSCTIVELLDFQKNSDSLFFLEVRFRPSHPKEMRLKCIKLEIHSRCPETLTKEMEIKEYIGKLFNVYKYDVRILKE